MRGHWKSDGRGVEPQHAPVNIGALLSPDRRVAHTSFTT